VLPDWPGVGRSGYIPLDKLTGEVVVEGLGKVLASLDQPAIIMTHSMSGAYGWKLLENYGEFIVKVVAVAPSTAMTAEPSSSSPQLLSGCVIVKVARGCARAVSAWRRSRDTRPDAEPCPAPLESYQLSEKQNPEFGPGGPRVRLVRRRVRRGIVGRITKTLQHKEAPR
jgi:pimeloyl-ACP methyl ester carboxylesterase